MPASESKQRLIQYRRDNGLCFQCGVKTKGSRCEACATKAQASRKKAQERKKSEGICQNSGCDNKAKPDCTVCEACSQQASEASSRRYERNKALGVCRYCGADSDGRARCDDCTAAFAEYSQEWYQRRKAAGLCVNCGGKRPKSAKTLLCKTCRETKNETAKIRWCRLKTEAFEAYGGPVCVGCGEIEVAILELDHIDGGGNQHRKQIGQSNIYLWLKQQSYPKGFRVLCPTCNKKAHLGLLKIR